MRVSAIPEGRWWGVRAAVANAIFYNIDSRVTEERFAEWTQPMMNKLLSGNHVNVEWNMAFDAVDQLLKALNAADVRDATSARDHLDAAELYAQRASDDARAELKRQRENT